MENSVNRSICLYCKASSQNNTDKQFHDIFDEVGEELQLPSLVENIFKVKVGNAKATGKDGKQTLCEDCVNKLIELFDLEEHRKETHAQHVVEEKQTAEAEETTLKEVNDDEIQSLSDIQEESIDYVEELADRDGDDDGVEKDADEYNEIQFDVKDECEALMEDNEHQELYIEEHSALNVESSTQYNHGDKTTQCEGEEESHNKLENLCDNGVITIEDYMTNDSIDEQSFINMDHTSESGVLVAYIEQHNTENSEYEEVIVGDQFYALEKIPESSMNSGNIDDVSQEAEYYEEYDESTMDVVEDNMNDENIVLDEEYLIEETVCSQEYDNVDLSEYLDSAIKTKIEELDLPFTIECKICLQTFDSFQVLLKHSCVADIFDEERNYCIVRDCDEIVNNIKCLGRHLLTMHHDNVESLAIYGRCPECKKSFSNLVDWNKHSCCILKRRPGIRNYCQTCSMDFQSQKRYVFHMQFHLTKHRPKICLLCGSSFNNITEFFEHVNYGHEPESTMACLRCDRFFKDNAVYNRHVLSHESKPHFKCSYCPKTYTNRNGLNSHLDIYHNHKTKPMQCEYCNKEFVSLSSYRSHMKVHMPEAYVPAFVCSVCGLISNNSDKIKNHIENGEEPDCNVAEVVDKIISVSYTCENCSLDFCSPRQLQAHRQSSSHNSKLFNCPICCKTFQTLQHMRNHMASHKDYDEWQTDFPIGRFYMCDIGNCRDAYPLWTSLYYHKKRHRKPEPNETSAQDENRFKCQFCEKLCPTKMSLAIHVARVHNNSHVKCHYCQKMYKTDRDLTKHIDYMHTSVECPQCQKVFKSRRNLLSHEHLVHKNEKRYFCGHCSKGYYYKSEMEAHEKNVHPDASYKCEICHFTTNYPKSLDIHMAKHNDQLPFKCSMCAKTFGRKQLLTVHEKRHMKTKEFVCRDYWDDGCDNAFITYSLLNKHIQRVHSSNKQSKQKAVKRRWQKTKNTSNHTLTKTTPTKRSRTSVIILQDDNSSVELIMGENDDAPENGNETQENDEEYDVHYEFKDVDGLDDDQSEAEVDIV